MGFSSNFFSAVPLTLHLPWSTQQSPHPFTETAQIPETSFYQTFCTIYFQQQHEPCLPCAPTAETDREEYTLDSSTAGCCFWRTPKERCSCSCPKTISRTSAPFERGACFHGPRQSQTRWPQSMRAGGVKGLHSRGWGKHAGEAALCSRIRAQQAHRQKHGSPLAYSQLR